jgi:hypothetical protein
MSITKTQYLEILASELHKPVAKVKHTLSYHAKEKDWTWNMDLVDMQEWKSENLGFGYILNCIDVHTRYAMSRPVKTKSAKDVLEAFKDIISVENRKPKHSIHCDQGKEFLNRFFHSWCEENNVTMYQTHTSQQKAVIVERFNRTLKTNMWKQFTRQDTHTWIHILPKLVENYNYTKHSKLKMTPFDASKEIYQNRIQQQVNPKPTDTSGFDRTPRFKPNEKVRISRAKQTFEKGYTPKWSHEVFTVDGVFVPGTVKEPIYYRVKDYNDELIEGAFYEPELAPVNPRIADKYLVERALKTRTINGKKEFFVKWVGYPEEFNSWITEENLVH